MGESVEVGFNEPYDMTTIRTTGYGGLSLKKGGRELYLPKREVWPFVSLLDALQYAAFEIKKSDGWVSTLPGDEGRSIRRDPKPLSDDVIVTRPTWPREDPVRSPTFRIHKHDVDETAAGVANLARRIGLDEDSRQYRSPVVRCECGDIHLRGDRTLVAGEYGDEDGTYECPACESTSYTHILDYRREDTPGEVSHAD